MKIDEDKVPATLDEAVDMLITTLSTEEKEYIKSNTDSSVHFTAGMCIRNNWGLWQSDSHLVQWFKANYQVIHADDISGLIIKSVWAKVTGIPFDIRAEVQKFHEHWRKNGIDPMKSFYY